MATPPTLAQGATQAQALAYLNAFWGSATYKNSVKTPYNGMTAAQIYAYLAKQDAGQASATPYNLAVATSDLLLSSGVGGTVGAAVDQAATTIGAVQTGVESASFLPSWATGLAGLLSALTSAATWVRVAKVIVGGGLVLIGVAHMTGASDAVSTVARKVPLPV